jgi:hypothetical protein
MRHQTASISTGAIRSTNIENIAQIKAESKQALMELVDECNNAINDEREFTLPSSKTSKVYDYYFYFMKQIENTKKWSIIIFFGIFFMFTIMGDKNFVISADNSLNQIILAMMVHLIIMGCTLFIFSEHSVERFFLSLYPNFKKEKNYSNIIVAIAKNVFKKSVLKERGFKFATYYTIFVFVVHLSNYFYFNVGASMFIGFILFVVWVIAQPKENFVFEYK